jgi:hypothetical protein
MFTILGLTQNLVNHKGKCPFCLGEYVLKGDEIRCLQCDRGTDILSEFQIWQTQTFSKFRDNHSYGRNCDPAALRLSKYRGA